MVYRLSSATEPNRTVMAFDGNPEHLAKLKKGVYEWNKWRDGHQGRLADLRGANLSRANLRGADLSGANLSNAVLIEAYLNGADLSGANLSITDLGGANLILANLYHANLSNAALIKADLSRANLYETILGDIDLSKTIGLETCAHVGPSIIDYRTLKKSSELPRVFLQGIGLPEWLIESAEANLHGAIRFYSCFISYSSKDEDFAKRLHADLQSQGVRCWFAPEDMKIGQRVRNVVEDAIRLHDKLILILSETSIESDWVEHEVTQALEREGKEKSEVLFPIRIDDGVLDAKFGWAKAIREAHKPTGRHIGNFSGWKDHDMYKAGFERLMRDLKA